MTEIREPGFSLPVVAQRHKLNANQKRFRYTTGKNATDSALKRRDAASLIQVKAIDWICRAAMVSNGVTRKCRK